MYKVPSLGEQKKSLGKNLKNSKNEKRTERIESKEFLHR